jgi:hypothetical protein
LWKQLKPGGRLQVFGSRKNRPKKRMRLSELSGVICLSALWAYLPLYGTDALLIRSFSSSVQRFSEVFGCVFSGSSAFLRSQTYSAFVRFGCFAFPLLSFTDSGFSEVFGCVFSGSSDAFSGEVPARQDECDAFFTSLPKMGSDSDAV